MAYTINLTDGQIFATIPDGTINTASSMTLVGKNYAGYGEFLDENFIRLLENGANTTAPSAPLIGQLWWDKTNNVMKVWNGTTFKTISAATASSAQPTNNITGDLWFNTTAQQLFVWNGSAFVLVGPASTAGQGTSGAVVTTVVDDIGGPHVVVQLFTANTIVATVSQDPTFTPATPIPGFATIGPGLQLSSAVASALFRGTATNAQTLDGIDSSQFLRSDIADTTSGTLGVRNDSGFTVGVDNDAQIAVVTANSEVIVRNQTQDANLSVRVNDGGVDTTTIFVNGSTGVVSIPTRLIVTGNVTSSQFVGNLTGDVTGNVVGNVVGNLTSPGSNTQVIFNDSGLANATSGLTFNKSSNLLSVGGNITTGQTGTVFTASIAKTSGSANAVGNIGNATNYFGTVHAANIIGSITTASQTNITQVGTLASLTVAGTAQAATFSGSGSLITSLNAGNLTTGTVPTARLASSGTPSASTFLRGDGTWSAGVSGPQGPQGTSGTPGPTGAQGTAGTPGSPGAQGPQGRQGATGVGSPGPQGAQGAPGAQGPTGGPPGPPGPAGAQGVSGSPGSPGPSGPPGPTGAQGVAGSPGPTGPTGPQGAASTVPGPPGAQGAQGAPGGGGITPGSQASLSSLGVGTAASGVQGEIRATNAITAFYSDQRLKTDITKIENALDRLLAIKGVTFRANEVAASYGYDQTRLQVGVLTQDVERVLPEVVTPAPFDIGHNADGTEYSKSGENYKTVWYDKLVPLIIEAIRELKDQVDQLRSR